MELREYWEIIRKDKQVIILFTLLLVVASFLYFNLRPVSYEVSLALNITRQGSQSTTEYRYDDFYRLQADEKFAETLVEWLKNPRLVRDIYGESGIETKEKNIRQLSRVFKSEKYSSQLVAVSYAAKDEHQAKKISDSISKVVEKNVDRLNEKQKEETWFKVIVDDPVIIKKQGDVWLMLVFPVFAGLFLGFWIVMLRHYLR